jgi:hypothetical protein
MQPARYTPERRPSSTLTVPAARPSRSTVITRRQAEAEVRGVLTEWRRAEREVIRARSHAAAILAVFDREYGAQS